MGRISLSRPARCVQETFMDAGRHQLVGTSAAIRQVEEEILYAARSDAKVLLSGESGVGKEVVARRIHEHSRRASGPLVIINCAGVPDSLLESELFGHVRGSFTDAHRDKRGLLELGHRGTVVLDEIGEMSLRMQAVLLRFLETGELQRVGAERHQATVDVRVIASTNRDLFERTQTKDFREDLYYRLNVIHLLIPPLRSRLEDVPALLTYFFRAFSQTHQVPAPELSADALMLLTQYEWPGNIREVRNLAERLVVRGAPRVILPQDLPPEVSVRRVAASSAPAAPDMRTALSVGELLFERLVTKRESFWETVYEPFMARDLTREELRTIVRLGLQHTRGSYKGLLALFNMPADDYKRMLAFLRKFQCHMPFQRFRNLPIQRSMPSAIEDTFTEPVQAEPRRAL